VLALKPARPKLLPLPEKFPAHRPQVFFVERGSASVPEDFASVSWGATAERAKLLFAGLAGVRATNVMRALARVGSLRGAVSRGFHLKTVAARGQHDSVV